MHAGLAARGLACVRVQAQVICENGQEITRLWRHDGLLSALAVAERGRWQLDGWRASAGGGDAGGGAWCGGGGCGGGRGRGGVAMVHTPGCVTPLAGRTPSAQGTSLCRR